MDTTSTAATSPPDPLERLTAGMPILYGGDRVTTVPATLAEAFAPGDALVVLQDSGELLHVPAADRQAATAAVDRAAAAFAAMGRVTEHQLDAFYTAFASRLEDDAAFAPIAADWC
jgi:glutamate-5-semialdehyde dehydrogenase